MEKLLLTTKDVANLLQVQPNKVYLLRKEDPTFPYHNLNGAIRYITEEVIEWVKSKEKKENYLAEKHLQED